MFFGQYRYTLSIYSDLMNKYFILQHQYIVPIAVINKMCYRTIVFDSRAFIIGTATGTFLDNNKIR